MNALQIQERYYNRFLNEARVSAVHTNRASDLGHDCERYLTLLRTAGLDRNPPSLELMLIFNEGKIQEQSLIRDLEAAGFKIEHAQRDFLWKDYNISGHMDFRLVHGGLGSVLCECKSMSPYIWAKIETVQDMIDSSHPWVRKYPAQIMLYLLLEGRDENGIFILKNKSNGQIKVIDVALDYGYAESLLKKAERINAHIAAGTLPDFIAENLRDQCEDCPFYGRACDPPMVNYNGATILNDDELSELLNKRAELSPLQKEFDANEKRIKEILGDRTNPLIVGNWIVQTKEVHKKAYTVNVKESSYLQRKYLPLEKKEAVNG